MAGIFQARCTLRNPSKEESCLTCKKECTIACLKCCKCNMFVHPGCSLLPPYMLLTYKIGSSKYYCQDCLKDRVDRYDAEIEQMTMVISMHDSNENNAVSDVTDVNQAEVFLTRHTQDEQNFTTQHDQIHTHKSSNSDPSNYVASSEITSNHADGHNEEINSQNSLKFSTPKLGNLPTSFVISPSSLQQNYDASIPIHNRFDPLGNEDHSNAISNLPPLTLDKKLETNSAELQSESSLITCGQRTPRNVENKSHSSSDSSIETSSQTTRHENSNVSYKSFFDSSAITSGQRSLQHPAPARPTSKISKSFTNSFAERSKSLTSIHATARATRPSYTASKLLEIKRNVICRFFLRNQCKYGPEGNGCKFIHSAHLNSDTKAVNDKAEDPAICKFFLRNACKFGKLGTRCHYYHPKICPNYKNCKSNDCKMHHPEICKSSREKWECFNRDCRAIHLKGTKRFETQSLNISANTVRPYGKGNASENFLGMQIKEIQTQLAAILKHLPYPWLREIPPPQLPLPQPQRIANQISPDRPYYH